MEAVEQTTWHSGDGLAVLHVGHVLDVLRSLPDDHFHCMVTSPPYWGLRDYGLPPSVWGDGWSGCYGLEPTIDQFIGHTVEVFREVRRVLRDDGVAWLNIGDSYNASPGQRKATDAAGAKQRTNNGSHVDSTSDPDLKPGDQCLIPSRVALALQADGWFIRSTVIWSKRSPMPESIGGWRWERCRIKIANGSVPRRIVPGREEVATAVEEKNGHSLAKWLDCPGCDKCSASDGYVLRKGRWRCTNSWEPIYQLAKGPEYFCDAEGVKEPASGRAPGNKIGSDSKTLHTVGGCGVAKRIAQGKVDGTLSSGVESRNPRAVWSLSAEPLKAKHFAAFPSTIPRRCIEASTSAAGCCPTCGSQWAPIVVKERVPTRPGNDTKVGRVSSHEDSPYHDQHGMIVGNRDPQRHIQRSRVLGYRPTCDCGPHEPIPCRVLEPFCGSGTTPMVARWLGRASVAVELSETYAREIAQVRIETPKPTEKRPKVKRRRKHKRERLLF